MVLIGYDRTKITANGWSAYPVLERLAQVVLLNMKQQDFLARCKSLQEVWQRVPNVYLKLLLEAAGCPTGEIKELGSLKLLKPWPPLFLNNDLRIADAHETMGRCLGTLQDLGFDTANINKGYGRAFNFVIDNVIKALETIVVEIENLLESQ